MDNIVAKVTQDLELYSLYQNELLLFIAIILVQEAILHLLDNYNELLHKQIRSQLLAIVGGRKKKSAKKIKKRKTKKQKGGHLKRNDMIIMLCKLVAIALFCIMSLSQVNVFQLGQEETNSLIESDQNMLPLPAISSVAKMQQNRNSKLKMILPTFNPNDQTFIDQKLNPGDFMTIIRDVCTNVIQFMNEQEHSSMNKPNTLISMLNSKFSQFETFYQSESQQSVIRVDQQVVHKILAPMCLLKLFVNPTGLEIDLFSKNVNPMFAKWLNDDYLRSIIEKNQQIQNELQLSFTPIKMVDPLLMNEQKKEWNADVNVNSPVMMVTASTNHRPWSDTIQTNQQDFCDRNRIIYRNFIGKLSQMPDDIQPQWLKVYYLEELLTQLQTAQNEKTAVNTIVWMDDDIVVTNPSDFIRKFEKDMIDANKHILISTDTGDVNQVNTGIMLIRNTAASLEMLKKIKNKTSQPVTVRHGVETTLGTCKDQSCLHEQQAFNQLLREDVDFQSKVYIFDSVDLRYSDRNLNTMNRVSHFDKKRDLYLDYENDNPKRSFRTLQHYPDITLNTCHASGMTSALRNNVIEECAQYYKNIIDQNQIKIEQKLSSSRKEF